MDWTNANYNAFINYDKIEHMKERDYPLDILKALPLC